MVQTYTTGETAKIAKVSVRTVQYYDKRGLLKPYQVTEGGRRLYSQAEIKQLEVITFLRQLDFSIEAIKSLLREDKASQILILLLNQRSMELKEEIALKKDQLDTVVKLLDSIPNQNQISPLMYLSDLSLTMKNKKSWKILQLKLFIALISLIVILGCLLYLATHFNQKWLIGLLVFFYILATTLLVKTYIDQVEYIYAQIIIIHLNQVILLSQ
ncbi:hypothetical protein HMPREF9318_01087 [Streptococcus urinalis FB127-CNA-2]|uniref:Transcriptional regulator, MerR family n=1 Tax=Streptococcus urinalis 2285-97 TaxID=764291 RepID=G5KHN0_9STRE|nr:MerR family transcriptional regulator [Streptococcus urinalis]EHJ57055.1 transcriptional regulator, MerR family [Streptococcus urinalis 2285-97]EKS21133.1 hypothetical protein HMPREF9318_01087 [Streptococcus urinalis FB127-CNA-2]VEF31142.1 transcriptional regulator, MerR family [Streptococcus urinalis]